MDGEKVLMVISIYRNYFEKSGIPKKKFPEDQIINTYENPFQNTLAHCHGMLDEMEKFVAEGRMEKVFRWLGFIQGCLWSAGNYELKDLKNHSRPDPKRCSDELIKRGCE